jgi:hypothetical protein
MIDIVTAVSPTLGINPWGMLGCALTYAAALFAAVDGMADHLIRRGRDTDPPAVHALRLKMGSKIAAAAIAVFTAAIVLVIDGNWIALGVLSGVFVAVVIWVGYVYRQGSRKEPLGRVGG